MIKKKKNQNKNCSFRGKGVKVDKHLPILVRKQKMQITNIRNERGIRTSSTSINYKRIL
jgi:hypothetical protein